MENTINLNSIKKKLTIFIMIVNYLALIGSKHDNRIKCNLRRII